MNKEDIINAGIKFTLEHHPVCICGGAMAESMKEFNRNAAFEAGAEFVLNQIKNINNEELKALADENCPIELYESTCEVDVCNWCDGFERGYKKALEKYELR